MESYPSTSCENENRPIKRRKRAKIVSCFVPMCPSSSTKFPNKRFLTVPINAKIRKMWMEAVNRYDTLSPKSVLRCCEDHFDVSLINKEESVLHGVCVLKFKLI